MFHTPDSLKNLESTLSGLAPAAAGLNRDRMLFEAGRQVAPRHRLWPILTILFAGLSAVLGWQLISRPEPLPPLVAPNVPMPFNSQAPSPSRETPQSEVAIQPVNYRNQVFRTTAGYLSHRDQVLNFGAEILPASPLSPDSPREPAMDLKTLHSSI